jgi:hypothetical protein
MWTSDGGGGKAWWLDNERILFPSNEKLVPGGGPAKMMVWNLSTGRVDPTPLTSVICAREGQVFFGRRDNSTNKVTYYRGPLENPREYPPPGPDMRLDDRFDCGWAPKFSRASVPYRIKLKDANYLEILKDEFLGENFIVNHGQVRYYEKLDLPPKLLAIYADLAGRYDIHFNQLQNAYFISPNQYFPDDPYYNSMWWLKRNGDLTEIPLPKNLPWLLRGGLDIYPLRVGYVAIYQGGGTRSMKDAGSRGLYLIKGDACEIVLLGSIHGISVSPDGCKAAFSYARNTEEYFSQKNPYRTVKTINFCEGSKMK